MNTSFTSSEDEHIQSVLLNKVDTYLKPDSYYEALATPLKSASFIKEEHREQIKEILSLKLLRQSFQQADRLIKQELPLHIPPYDYEQVSKEIDQSTNHLGQVLMQCSQKEKEALPVIVPQHLYGFSDQTLLHVYGLAEELYNRKQYQEAHSLFHWLAALAPDIPAYWLSIGLCLQGLAQPDIALIYYEIAQTLSPQDPLPFAYAAFAHHQLKDRSKTQEYIQLAEQLMSQSPNEELQSFLNQFKAEGQTSPLI